MKDCMSKPGLDEFDILQIAVTRVSRIDEQQIAQKALDVLRQRRSIVQDWAAQLGLRYQGVLMSAVRGCDILAKEAGAKRLTRYYRSAVLNAHCGDPAKAQSFIQLPKTSDEFNDSASSFFQEWDALPIHYVMHLVHAAEIIGYYHPVDPAAARALETQERFQKRVLRFGSGSLYSPQHEWLSFYTRACKKLHINPETKEQLAERLDATEDNFGKAQKE